MSVLDADAGLGPRQQAQLVSYLPRANTHYRDEISRNFVEMTQQLSTRKNQVGIDIIKADERRKTIQQKYDEAKA